MNAVVLETGLLGMACEAQGAARPTPLLFLHGMNAGAWQFEALQPFFAARGYRSLALNVALEVGEAGWDLLFE